MTMLNADEFIAGLRVEAQSIPPLMQSALIQTTRIGQQVMQNATRVRTGRAQGSYRVGQGFEDVSSLPRVNHRGVRVFHNEVNVSSFQRFLATVNPFGAVHITNRVPYIVELDQKDFMLDRGIAAACAIDPFERQPGLFGQVTSFRG